MDCTCLLQRLAIVVAITLNCGSGEFFEDLLVSRKAICGNTPDSSRHITCQDGHVIWIQSIEVAYNPVTDSTILEAVPIAQRPLTNLSDASLAVQEASLTQQDASSVVLDSSLVAQDSIPLAQLPVEVQVASKVCPSLVTAECWQQARNWRRCIGKQSCEFNKSHIRMELDQPCSVAGSVSPLYSNYLYIQYNCVPFPDSDWETVDICSSVDVKAFTAQIVSPGFPAEMPGSPKTCSCNITPIASKEEIEGAQYTMELYILHLPSHSEQNNCDDGVSVTSFHDSHTRTIFSKCSPARISGDQHTYAYSALRYQLHKSSQPQGGSLWCSIRGDYPFRIQCGGTHHNSTGQTGDDNGGSEVVIIAVVVVLLSVGIIIVIVAFILWRRNRMQPRLMHRAKPLPNPPNKQMSIRDGENGEEVYEYIDQTTLQSSTEKSGKMAAGASARYSTPEEVDPHNAASSTYEVLDPRTQLDPEAQPSAPEEDDEHKYLSVKSYDNSMFKDQSRNNPQPEYSNNVASKF